jgi:hypothetical protein
MEAGAIVGIVVGSVVGLVVVVVAIVAAFIGWVKHDYNSNPLHPKNVVYIRQNPLTQNLLRKRSHHT